MNRRANAARDDPAGGRERRDRPRVLGMVVDQPDRRADDRVVVRGVPRGRLARPRRACAGRSPAAGRAAGRARPPGPGRRARSPSDKQRDERALDPAEHDVGRQPRQHPTADLGDVLVGADQQHRLAVDRRCPTCARPATSTGPAAARAGRRTAGRGGSGCPSGSSAASADDVRRRAAREHHVAGRELDRPGRPGQHRRARASRPSPSAAPRPRP